MSTTKQFTNIKSGKKYQIDASARGYYDFRTTTVAQPNNPLSYDMKVYDGLNYKVDLTKNDVIPAEINFDGTVLPYIDNNELKSLNYVFGESETTYEVPVYEKVYDNLNFIGSPIIKNDIASDFSRDNYLTLNIPNYSSGSVDSFQIVMKVHTPIASNKTSNGRILNSTDSYDNLAIDLGTSSGFNFCNKTIAFNTTFDDDIDLWVKIIFDGSNLTLNHSLDGSTYTEDNTSSWDKSDVWFTSNTYSIGLRSYDFVGICYWNGTIDLSESSIIINESTIVFNDGSLSPKLTNYNLVGNAKINGSICSGFDSSSRITLPNTISSTEKPMIVKFKTGSNVSSSQKIIEKDDDGISFQITGGKIQYWIKESRTWNDFADVETNAKYELKVTVTSDTTYTIDFKKESDTEYTSVNVSDASFTVGEDLLYSVGNSTDNFKKPFLGTIDISGVPGLIYATESKTGIFKDYTDNGKAKTLNCFSNSNNYTVLTPNEDIENIKYYKYKYYKYSYQTFTRPNMTKDVAVGGDEFGAESDISMLDGNNVFKGFDNNMTTYFHSDSGKTVGYFTFYNPNPLKVTALTFTQQDGWLGRSTSGGTVYGSNDNTNWTKIIDFTHSEQVLTWTLDLSSNNEYYKYYKVYSNGTLSDSYYVFADCAITADEKITTEGTPDDYDEKIITEGTSDDYDEKVGFKYTYLGTVDIPNHNIYDVDDFYGWSKDSQSIFTKTLQLSINIPLYNSSYKQEDKVINGTFTTTPVESDGIVSDFNSGILKLSFTDPTTEIKFYSKVTASDQNHERQIMGVEGTSNNIGRDNNVWRLWNGSGHYGSSFDIDTNYWVCLVDNRSGTYTMYVLKDADYTKDALPELSSWNKEFEISGSFFESTNCLIGGAIYDSGSVSENWTGTIDLNNTWFESGDTKLWEGRTELKISSFTDDSITLSNNEVYTRNETLDKHFVLPKSDPTPVEPSDESDTAIAFNEEVANQDLGSDIYVNSGQGINEYYYTAYPVNDTYKSNSTILATISKKTQSGDNTLIDFDRKEESKVLTLDVSTNEDDAVIVTNNYEPTKVDFNIVQDDVNISTQSYNDGNLPSSKYSMLNFKFNVDVTDDEVEIVVDGIKYKLSDLPIVASITSGYGVKVNKSGYKPYQTIGRKWYKNVININLETEE